MTTALSGQPDRRFWLMPHASPRLLLFVAILLLAAFLRLAAFGEAPPGLQHDEMFKALEGRRLLQAGDFRVFYPTNQGHEGAYVWALAVSMALLGVNLLAIKFPAFVFGMLTVALTIRLAGRLSGARAAAIAGGLSAVSFFALFSSRVGLRAVMLPVFVLWFLLALHDLLSPDRHEKSGGARFRPALSAGLALGLSIYTYTSAFALWGGVGALVLALLAFSRPRGSALWRPLLLIIVIGGLISVPMLLARATDPQGFNRSGTITRPLIDALAGRPQELIENGIKLLGMAVFTGDPEARYNLPGRPYFPLPIGLLVYGGLVLMIWRVRRQPIYAALLGIMAAGLIPGLLTVSAPSFLRSIALLPLLMLCVALALDRLPGIWGVGGGIIAVTLLGLVDARAYFIEWPRLPEVQAIYRDDLEQLARTVSHTGGLWLVSTPDVEQDYLTFSLIAADAAAQVAFFDGDTTVAFSDGARLAISPLAPLTPPHQPFLTEGFGVHPATGILRQDGEIAYDVFQLDSAAALQDRLERSESEVYIWPDAAFKRGPLAAWALPVASPVNFGGLVRLAGVELSDRVIATDHDGLNLQLFLQPLVDHPDQPLGVFVHIYRQNTGQLHAQRDLMGMPSGQWMRGITFVQDNFVIMGPTRPGWYMVVMGVYDVITGERLPVTGAAGEVLGDHVLIGRISVGE